MITGVWSNILIIIISIWSLLFSYPTAEKAAQLHSTRVKELSVDLRQERARNTAMENSYQGKLAKNQEDMENLKGKLERYKKDVEELQNSENSLTIQKLKEDNSSFQHQLAQMLVYFLLHVHVVYTSILSVYYTVHHSILLVHYTVHTI